MDRKTLDELALVDGIDPMELEAFNEFREKCERAAERIFIRTTLADLTPYARFTQICDWWKERAIEKLQVARADPAQQLRERV